MKETHDVLISFLSKPALRPQARSASPSPLCVPKPALRPQARTLAVIEMCLAACLFTLLLALPSHAQWQVQQADGTPINSGSNGYTLHATQTGTNTNSYPPSVAPDTATSDVPALYDPYQRVDYSAFVLDASNTMGGFHPGFYTFEDGSTLPWNGTLTSNIDASLEADWVWVGPVYELFLAGTG